MTSSCAVRPVITTRRYAGYATARSLVSAIRQLEGALTSGSTRVALTESAGTAVSDGPPCPKGCGPMDQCETDWALCRTCRYHCWTDGPDEEDVSPTTELPMETPGQRKMYLIIAADGRVRGSGKSAATLYATAAAAQNRCRVDGDSVVEVTINLRAEPLFIRRKTL